jgi:predicted acetyltransferase
VYHSGASRDSSNTAMATFMATLVEPDVRHKDSYISMLLEHQARGRFLDSRQIDNNVARLERDFIAFVDSLAAAHDLNRLRPGRIPEYHYWLISDNDVVGRSTLRPTLSDAPEFRDLGHIGYDVRPSAEGHGFGKRALHLTLARAQTLGLKRVLLTCDSSNAASKRIIESSRGEFEGAVPIAGRSYQRLRYWITLA